MKRKIILCCSLLLLLASCISLTKKLWIRTYDENFYNFLVGNDGRSVVFLGKQYHYILHDNSGVLRRLLAAKNLRKSSLFINAKETELKVDLQNRLSGYVIVESFFNALPRRDYVFLRSLGFKSNGEGVLTLKMNITGGRYLPRHDLGTRLPSLSREYKIPIRYESDSLGNFAKVALTPITVAADATILLGNVILLPFRGLPKSYNTGQH